MPASNMLSPLVNSNRGSVFQGLWSRLSKMLVLMFGNGKPYWETYLGEAEQYVVNSSTSTFPYYHNYNSSDSIRFNMIRKFQDFHVINASS